MAALATGGYTPCLTDFSFHLYVCLACSLVPIFAWGCSAGTAPGLAPLAELSGPEPRASQASVSPPGAASDSELEAEPEEVGPDLSGLSREELWAYYNELRGDPYLLDSLGRHLETPGEQVPCNRDNLAVYRGTEVPFAPVSVHPAFVERMQRFERALNEAAIQVYGRKPLRVRHLGGFSCRKSRFRSLRISEHALGNAIDIMGFDFGPAEKDEADPGELPAELPKQLHHAFQVRVQKHWQAVGHPTNERHSEFLRLLTARIVDESIFRIALGPSHLGHADHFHFDMSPWRYVHL